MTVETQTLDALKLADDWELARQTIAEHFVFHEARLEIEAEYQIRIGDPLTLKELPDDSFKRLKKRLTETTEEYFINTRDELDEKVCKQFNYCAMKKKWGWRVVEYLIAAVDIFATQGGASLAMLALKKEVFDKLCGCPD